MDSTDNFQAQLQSTEFLSWLAFLTDITNHLNVLNLSLHEKGQSVSHLVGHLEGFHSKLRLFTDYLQNSDLAHFSCCSVIKEKYFNADFIPLMSNIASLSEEFHSRFEDFHKLKSLLALYNKPVQVNAVSQPSEIQILNSSYVLFRRINFYCRRK